ncbi:MAG: hypothetical protein FWG45_00920 [Oscillospiraceae bacterium]|nr:hypothetical protein [Oscillospiraceae bacterium]
MLHEILTPADCAACKGCCIFAAQELWEAPDCVLPLDPPNEETDCYTCRHLTDSGCELGGDKPPDCAMYPFRVMRLGDCRVVAVSRYCKAVNALPLRRLCEFADTHCAAFTAITTPDMVKPYNDEYVILRVLSQ